MEEYISQIFNLLLKLQKTNKHNVFSIEEINEQIENIQDLSKDIEKLHNILESINTIPNENNENLCSKLFDLHIAIDDIEWQYDQIHTMVRKYIAYFSNEKEPFILKTLVYDEVEDETED